MMGTQESEWVKKKKYGTILLAVLVLLLPLVPVDAVNASYAVVVYPVPGGYHAEDCYGTILAEGPDAAEVIAASLQGLTQGRTWKERVLLKGFFLLFAPIYLPSYTTLEIQGYLKLGDGVNMSVIYVENQVHVEVTGGTVDQNGRRNVGRDWHDGSCVFIVGSRYVRVNGVHAYDAEWSGVGVHTGSQYVQVTDCILEEFGLGEGVSLCQTTNSLVSNCVSVCTSKVGHHGFYLGGTAEHPSAGNVISGCVARGNILNGINAVTGGPAPRGCFSNTITGCTVEGALNYGVVLGDTEDMVVTGCTIQGCYTGIVVCSISYTPMRNTIEGNTVVDSTTLDGIKLLNARYCKVQDNTVTGSKRYGIYIQSSDYNTVSGNLVMNSYNTNIQLYDSDANTVTGNTGLNSQSQSTHGIGIIANSKHNLIALNRLTDDQTKKTQAYGGCELDGADYNHILLNILYGNRVSPWYGHSPHSVFLSNLLKPGGEQK